MQEIVLQSVPSQTLKAVLDGQNCQINIYQKEENLFFDLFMSGLSIVSCVICRDCVPLVCIQYSGFSGNLIFVDTRGNDNPDYTGLNDRFTLNYLTASEYGQL